MTAVARLHSPHREPKTDSTDQLPLLARAKEGALGAECAVPRGEAAPGPELNCISRSALGFFVTSVSAARARAYVLP